MINLDFDQREWRMWMTETIEWNEMTDVYTRNQDWYY